MQEGTALLLSPPTNFAVVHLPGRSFPGIVVQGDTMNGLINQLNEMARLLEAGMLADLGGELSDIKDNLSSALIHYEHVCKERGIPLPYPKSR